MNPAQDRVSWGHASDVPRFLEEASSSENTRLKQRVDRLEQLVERLKDPPRLQLNSSEMDLTPDHERGVVRASHSTFNRAMLEPAATTFPQVELTGFFQADVGWVSQTSESQAAVGEVPDGADFRRARLAGIGKVAENVAYIVEMDFAFPGRPSFMDVWAEIQGLDWLKNVRVGQFRQPFGLDGLTSVKELTFLERGLPFAFLPFRQIGVMAHGVSDDENGTWAISGFRGQTDVFGGNVGDYSSYGMATRLTRLLFGGDENVHVGFAYSVFDPSTDTVQYRNQPEYFVSDLTNTTPFFVNTGSINASLVNLFNGELAATVGPWHAQAEAVWANVNRTVGSNVTFSGVSVQQPGF